MTETLPVWSSPVRYGEVDQQGVVFNAHYLLYCDEAMNAFCAHHGLLGFGDDIQLVASSLTWTGPAKWGDVIEVTAACTRVGTTSLTMRFEVHASGRACCVVETTYVVIDTSGAPTPVDDATRSALTR